MGKPQLQSAGGLTSSLKRETTSVSERERERASVSPAAGSQATEQTKREKFSGQGTRTRIMLHQAAVPAPLACCAGPVAIVTGTRTRQMQRGNEDQ